MKHFSSLDFIWALQIFTDQGSGTFPFRITRFGVFLVTDPLPPAESAWHDSGRLLAVDKSWREPELVRSRQSQHAMKSPGTN